MSLGAISESSTIVVASDVLASELGSEHVLLNLKNGTYYGLEDVGSEIWRLIQQPVVVGEICRTLVETFEVDPDRCVRDVMSLMNDLLANGLIDVGCQAS